MKYLFVILFNVIQLVSFAQKKDIVVIVDTTEARLAFEYLNKVRQNPAEYSKEIGVSLRYVKSKPILRWNDTLARVAQAKALDMAKRDFFKHVDPDGNGINFYMNKAGYRLNEAFLKKKSLNNFESIQAGAPDGVSMINDLILDKGINPPGHRNHLLGIDEFWSNCYDVGIGFVRVPEGRIFVTYTCVIIAKHDF